MSIQPKYGILSPEQQAIADELLKDMPMYKPERPKMVMCPMSNIDKQARAELRKRYTPPEIPKCCICGAALSVQSCGGGEPTVYACDGYEPDPDNPGHVRRAAGRSVADRHYDMSRYIDWLKGGDPEVIALLDELEAAEKRIAEMEDIAKSVKFDPIPMEDLGNKSDGKKHPYMFGAGYNSAVVHCESVLLQAFSAAAGKGE